MRFKTLTILAIFTFALSFIGCGGQPSTNNASSATETNTKNITTNSNGPVATTKTPEIATTNDAPTFTPVVKAYCEGMIKKDEAAVRKVYSQETLKIFEADMKDEKMASLVEFLASTDPIKDVSKCGARNEKIEGEKGSAEIRNENMPNGVTIEFVKENGEWKLTTKSPDFDKVKESAANSNAAK
jgi:hypothetical protein